MLVGDGERVMAVRADSFTEVLGANTIAEMMHLDAAVRATTSGAAADGAGSHHLPSGDLCDRR